MDIKSDINSKYPQETKTLEIQVWSNKHEKDILNNKIGTYRDLSPGYRKTHNIDMHFKSHGVYRKWKEINIIFKEIHHNSNEAKYFNVCGQAGAGKTVFIEELARMFVERGMFEAGVYIIKGKEVQ